MNTEILIKKENIQPSAGARDSETEIPILKILDENLSRHLGILEDVSRIEYEKTEEANISESVTQTLLNNNNNPSSLDGPNKKKRKITEVQEDVIDRYLLPIHVIDYDTVKRCTVKQVFEDVDMFHLWISRNSQCRIKHNRNNTYDDSKTKNLVTKRYLYYRVDEKAYELEEKINRMRKDNEYFKNKYVIEKEKKEIAEERIDMLEEELNKSKMKESELLNAIEILKYNNNVLQQQNTEISNQAYNFMMQQSAINQLMLHKTKMQ